MKKKHKNYLYFYMCIIKFYITNLKKQKHYLRWAIDGAHYSLKPSFQNMFYKLLRVK